MRRLRGYSSFEELGFGNRDWGFAKSIAIAWRDPDLCPLTSRLLVPLTRWRKYDEARQALMRGELERILASGELSSDVYKVVSKSLA